MPYIIVVSERQRNYNNSPKLFQNKDQISPLADKCRHLFTVPLGEDELSNLEEQGPAVSTLRGLPGHPFLMM